MRESDGINLANMIKYFSNKEVCPCFDKIEFNVSSLSPIGDMLFEIYLYQDYNKSYEMDKMKERYLVSAGRGETCEAAMMDLSSKTRFLK